MEMEQKDCSLKVDKLHEKHGWIATEKQLFGKSGTDYDFSTSDPYKSREELDKLQAEQSRFAIFTNLLFECPLCFIQLHLAYMEIIYLLVTYAIDRVIILALRRG